MVNTVPARAPGAVRVLGLIAGVTVTVLALMPPALATKGAGRAGAAGADTASVEQLRLDVARTGDRLAAATIAWERGQQRLAVLIQRKISTGQAADALAVDAQQAQLRISALANALYRNPVDPLFTAVLTGDPNALTDVAYVRRALRQTSTDQQHDARLLATRVAQAQVLIHDQAQAAVEAVAAQKRLDADLLKLQADAQSSLGRLQAALLEIRRQQAAASAAAAAALGVATATGSGAGCASEVPADAINGFLPPSSLCPLRTAPGQRLIAPAAAAFDALSVAFQSALNAPLCVTDSYRDYASQVRVFATKPNLAATPGRSKHGLGRAVDLCGGVQNYGTAPYTWLKQNAPAFGFAHPDWAEPDGSRPEPWHWEFQG
jgi:D-alanyl-D-alanine carboxypeptidase